MQIQIIDRINVLKINPNVPYIIISINDINQENLIFDKNNYHLDTLYLKFVDVNCYDNDIIYMDAFNVNIAIDIFKFVDKYKYDIKLIIIQCTLGVSRSAAIGAILDEIFNMNKRSSILDDIKYNPNIFIYNIMKMVFYRKHNELICL